MWRGTFGRLGTNDEALAQQLKVVAWVATGEASVLIRGETGTGKEVLARSIHEASGRTGPFVAVNCAAVSAQLLGSELFGHVRGAFTGAESERAGALASAHEGTLFLDEIADAPLNVQVSLLRALDSGLVKPVGADHERPVNLRILAATSQDLDALIESGRFRRDLYYRLRGFEVTLPPLRERKADVAPLANLLLQELTAGTASPGLSASALSYLTEQALPGNVRQLRNVLQTAAALCPGEALIGCKEVMTVMGKHTAPLQPHANGAIPGPGAATPPLDLSPVPLGHLDGEPPPSLARCIPEDVRLRAMGWHRTSTLRLPENLTRRAARAEERLQLIFLLETYGYPALQPELQKRARRLFAPDWQLAEDGAAGRQVAKRMGPEWERFEFVGE